jgi:apolipoprotein D and lipocalin family protein
MRRLLLLAVLALGACATAPARPPVQTVEAVDLQRYAGTWHEIARFPNSFQDGRGRRCVATTAEYALRPDGQVAVTNRCLDAADGNRETVARGTAYAVAGGNNAKLRVSFFWPFYGDYWVIGLDPAYRWAVVGSPDRQFLWILSREPAMAAGDYAQAVGIAAAQGFDVARLQPTPQAGR